MRRVVSLGYIVRLRLTKQNRPHSKCLRKWESRAQREPDFLYDCRWARAWTSPPATVSEEVSGCHGAVSVSVESSLVLALTKAGQHWQLSCLLCGIVMTIG